MIITDVNECDILHPCGKICTEKRINYSCQCRSGYKLRADNVTCEGKCCNLKALDPGLNKLLGLLSKSQLLLVIFIHTKVVSTSYQL